MSLPIVFFGTPDFAIPTLVAMHEDPDIDLRGVLTQPDRPAGRGKKLRPSPVKAWAQNHDLDVIAPESLKEEGVMPWLEARAPEAIVVVAYGGFVRKPVRELPPHGCVNLHPSLLPRYRGAAPIQWAIMNGDSVTGNSTMYLSKGWDDGDVIDQEEEPILPTDTYGTLSQRLAEKGAGLMRKSLHAIAAGTAPRVPQPEAGVVMAPLISNEDARIHWRRPAQQIHNQVRGLNPVPGAFTFLDGQRLKVLRTEVIAATASAEPGTVISTEFNTIRVAAQEGIVEILELQPAGKKAMRASDFLRGHTIPPKTRCE